MGWILLGLLGLMILVLAVALLSRVEFAGSAYASAELDQTDEDHTQLALLAALDPAVAEALDIDFAESDQDDLRLEASYAGRLRGLGGLVLADQDGIYLLGRRLGGRGGKTPATWSPTSRSRRARRQTGKAAEDATAAAGKTAGKDAASTKSSRRAGRRTSISWRQLRQLWPPARQALLRSWSGLGLRLRLKLVYGLDEPATTGVLAGILPAAAGATLSGLNRRRPGSVSFRFVPVFDREALAAEIELSGDTRLGRVVWPLVRLALRREFRRLWCPGGRRRRRKTRKEMAR